MQMHIYDEKDKFAKYRMLVFHISFFIIIAVIIIGIVVILIYSTFLIIRISHKHTSTFEL